VAAGIFLGGEHLTAIAAVGAVLVIAGAFWGQSIERVHRAAAEEKTAPTTLRTTV
jgi:drug/metabolite transporter (DMT)-like permease